MSLHHLKPHSYVRQFPSFPPLMQSKSSQEQPVNHGLGTFRFNCLKPGYWISGSKSYKISYCN